MKRKSLGNGQILGAFTLKFVRGRGEQHSTFIHILSACYLLYCMCLGTMFGGTLVHYQNKNGQYLAPDSTATPLSIHWLVRDRSSTYTPLLSFHSSLHTLSRPGEDLYRCNTFTIQFPCFLIYSSLISSLQHTRRSSKTDYALFLDVKLVSVPTYACCSHAHAHSPLPLPVQWLACPLKFS